MQLSQEISQSEVKNLSWGKTLSWTSAVFSTDVSWSKKENKTLFSFSQGICRHLEYPISPQCQQSQMQKGGFFLMRDSTEKFLVCLPRTIFFSTYENTEVTASCPNHFCGMSITLFADGIVSSSLSAGLVFIPQDECRFPVNLKFWPGELFKIQLFTKFLHDFQTCVKPEAHAGHFNILF